MKENHTLLLRSQIATNRISGASQINYQYNVNWSTILPRPDNINQKYLVRFNFMTLAQSSATTELYQIFIDFGGSNMYDQTNNKSTCIGYVYPMVTSSSNVSGTSTAYGYTVARATDNVPVTIEYPNNSMITVTVTNTNTAGGATLGKDYIMTLEFTPV